jgi:hypothetical protein
MESNDAGLQLEAGVELGELREIDVGGLPSAVPVRRTGESKSPAKRLKWGGGALFFFRRLLNPSELLSARTEPQKSKNRQPEFSDHQSNFFSAYHSHHA